MSLANLLKNRSSIRAFTNKSVSKDKLIEIFSLAQQSISNCNVQPWQSMVISGETRNSLKQALQAEILAGKQPNPEFDWLPKYQGVHRDRQFGAANALYGAMNIERSDKEARQASMLRNWSFFDAPHAVFFCMEKYLGIMGAVDMGIYAQTLSLIMQEAGISSCMQGALGQFPQPIKQILELPDNVGILFGMSFGYADKSAKVNSASTVRTGVEESVTFFD